MSVCEHCGAVFTQSPRRKRFCGYACYFGWMKATAGGRCEASECPDEAVAKGLCRRHYNLRYYATNRQREQERARRWHRENPEQAAIQRRRRDPEKLRVLARAYQRTHRERVRTSVRNQYARRYGAVGHATVGQVAARVAFFGWRCWMCGAPWSCIDHVKPIARGGTNWPANLRPACGSCNSAKGDQWKGAA